MKLACSTIASKDIKTYYNYLCLDCESQGISFIRSRRQKRRNLFLSLFDSILFYRYNKD